MKKGLFFTFMLLAQMTLWAQEKGTAELKEYFYDAEFFFAQEEYIDALYDYMELYKSGFEQNANINYRMGICYLNISGQKDKAIPHLLEAVKNVSKKYSESKFKQKSAPIDAWLFLGNAYRVNNKLTDAIAAYTQYKEIATNTEDIKYADQQISACKTAMGFMDNPLRVKLTNLGDSVNGVSSNFKGVVSGNGKTLLYMNELPFYDAVYYCTFTGQGWSSPINITPQIQSDGDQYVTSVSYDGTTLYLTREDAFNSDIYVSHFENGRWTKSIPLAGEDINTKYWESHASVSKDGKTLYFTSNRKNGVGDMDIYRSEKLDNGLWGPPKNLGPSVNTPLNEDTPFISENDSLLYFSSQGYENMGGYDIFVTRLTASGQWSSPENLRYPVNTTDDDLFFYPWNNAQVGYISRFMEGGFGKEDIYAVQSSGGQDVNELIAGFIRKTEGPQLAELVEPEESKEPEKPAEPETSVEPEQPVEPSEPVAPKEIELDPVYFGFDNDQIANAAKLQLDKVVGLMNEFQEIRIKLIGHTDAMGPAAYNEKLSKRRAMAARNYITAKGINVSRIELLAMGERNFAAINSKPDGSDCPEGRRLNRRVEFEIRGANDILITIIMSPIPENLKFRE